MCLTSNKYQSDWNMDQNELSAASTRHLKICNIAPATSLVILYGTLQEFGDIQEFYTQKLHPDGFCVVSYFDIRDSMTAYRKLQAEHPLSIQFCPSGYVTMLVIGSNISGRGADRQSDIMCIVTSGGCSSNVPRILYYVLSDFGSISKFTVLENSSPPAFLVTFFDTHDAFDIIDTLDGQYVEGFRLKLSFYDPDILTWNPGCSALRTRTDENGRVHIVSSQDTDVGVYTPRPSHPSIDFTCRRDSGSSVDGRYGADREGEKYLEAVYSGGYVTPKRSGLTSLNLKPSYRRTPDNFRTDSGQFQDLFSYLPSNKSHVSDIKIKDPTCSYPLFDNRMSPKSNERLHGQAQVPGKNVIDLERIARGLDTRTTVMLRNIPNKVDQQTLKDYVDTTSKGLYNFLYLRIDFRNICNVGYAFINFIDPLDIIDFVKEKSGTRWNKFNSEKVLDVTYANIQGIDQLVEKFRNSSVMDQDPSYRPKLFHSSGPLTGTEKEFPPANNILKKCRSISAAQQIGLFAPKMSTNGKGIWRKRD
ncbi:RNA recognition motif 2-domain-containing protein [Morchella snyderi]|nr:RNA recognition motif 2-domain-containing protein [Morchella snyderi]